MITKGKLTLIDGLLDVSTDLMVANLLHSDRWKKSLRRTTALRMEINHRRRRSHYEL